MFLSLLDTLSGLTPDRERERERESESERERERERERQRENMLSIVMLHLYTLPTS